MSLLDFPVGVCLDWYRQMCLVRAFDSEIAVLNKAGLVPGTAHLYIGMEAIAVGACAAMEEKDLLTSTHRGHGHAIARGLDLGRMLAEILGRRDGYCRGIGGSMHITDIARGMLGADGIVGGGIPIAVGAALGARLQRRSLVVFCFFGDGAANEGSFHEALNLAALLGLGVVFVCENNQWALSTPFVGATAGGNVANRAAAYGMRGERVDGNDVEAVFRAASNAAGSARRGEGPALLECVSYRLEPHSIFTRQETRSKVELDEWRQKDPIARHRALLLELKIATVETLSQIDSGVAAEIAKAVGVAKNSPVPDPETAFRHVYE
jgi:TPP-dependent pyruvate/acetoin dehydrogenase alpha subunit